MSQDSVMALILAGGSTHTLGLLEKKRTKAAIPIGGMYRLIDFALSSLANSGINRVGVLTQYRPSSLIEHIYFGKPWDLKGRSREVRMLPPYTGENESSWYKGTADAVYQNLNFITDHDPEHVLVLSGEHVYNLDFNKVIAFHKEKKADVTVVVKNLNNPVLNKLSIITDKDSRIISFSDKSAKSKNNLVSLTIYLFNKDVLLREVRKDAKSRVSEHVFAKNILPNLVKNKRVYAYNFDGDWYYISTIRDYWDANMKMLSVKPTIDPEKWGVRTNLEDRKLGDRPSAYIKNEAVISNSRIPRGCIINGEVRNSVLFPGVIIEKGAKVVNSVIMHDSHIGVGAYIENAVLDKDVKIKKMASIGVGRNFENDMFPSEYNTGITVVGKSAIVPENQKIGKNCLIADGVVENDYSSNETKSGACVIKGML
ncbi:MAG: glucose-1-phosphate adenylyltransferase subunit GlgD [Elusimicrobiota bacterium]